MTYEFRKAIREPTSALVALAGPSGSGKTCSGLRLAIGLARGWRNGRVAMIDSEHRRGTYFADLYDYDYIEMKPPFSPQAYQAIVIATDQAGYGAIFVDSESHEWNGEGGCQDIHDAALERLIKGDPGRAEAVDGLAWKEAKLPHKKMMGVFTRRDAHLVFGLRAEDKIKYVRDGGKTKVEHVGFQPICEKGFMFEMLCSFLLSPETPGLPNKPIKIDGRHRPYFPPDEPISEECGVRLGEWARGASSGSEVHPSQTAKENAGTVGAVAAEPSAEPDDPRARAKLIASIKALAPKVAAAERENGKRTYGVTDPQAATLSSLRKYESWLRTRAGEAA